MISVQIKDNLLIALTNESLVKGKFRYQPRNGIINDSERKTR